MQSDAATLWKGRAERVANHTQGRGRKRRWSVFRIVVWVVIAILALLLLPYLLVVLY